MGLLAIGLLPMGLLPIGAVMALMVVAMALYLAAVGGACMVWGFYLDTCCQPSGCSINDKSRQQKDGGGSAWQQRQVYGLVDSSQRAWL